MHKVDENARQGKLAEFDVMKALTVAGCAVNSLAMTDYGLDVHVMIPARPVVVDDKEWFLDGRTAAIQVKSTSAGSGASVEVAKVASWVTGSSTGVPVFVITIDTSGVETKWRLHDPWDIRKLYLKATDKDSKQKTITFGTSSGMHLDLKWLGWILDAWTRFPQLLLLATSRPPLVWQDLERSARLEAAGAFLENVVHAHSSAFFQATHAETEPELLKDAYYITKAYFDYGLGAAQGDISSAFDIEEYQKFHQVQGQVAFPGLFKDLSESHRIEMDQLNITDHQAVRMITTCTRRYEEPESVVYRKERNLSNKWAHYLWELAPFSPGAVTPIQVRKESREAFSVAMYYFAQLSGIKEEAPSDQDHLFSILEKGTMHSFTSGILEREFALDYEG